MLLSLASGILVHCILFFHSLLLHILVQMRQASKHPVCLYESSVLLWPKNAFILHQSLKKKIIISLIATVSMFKLFCAMLASNERLVKAMTTYQRCHLLVQSEAFNRPYIGKKTRVPGEKLHLFDLAIITISRAEPRIEPGPHW